MRIGLQIPSFTWPGGPTAIARTLANIATTAESAGFYSVWVMDHFFQRGPAEVFNGVVKLVVVAVNHVFVTL